MAVCALLGAFPVRAGAETVTVDLSVSQGAPNYAGSGFLHGMTPTQPPAAMVDPLKPKMFRCSEFSQCFQIYPRAQALGAKVQFAFSDSQGYRAPWPGDNGDWSAWLATVSRIVNQAKVEGKTYQWDIWNEPDTGYFWGRPIDQFYETWRRTCLQVRAIEPNATIVGPSMAWYGDGGWLKNFLLYAKANNVLPNVLSWHLDPDGATTSRNVAAIRQFMAANGIDISRISLNETVAQNDWANPGAVVGHLAAIGRSGIESAARSCWTEGGGVSACGNYSLDGILTATDKTPRASWWVYKGYADITGTLVRVTPGTYADAVAGLDAGQRTLRVIVGGNDPAATTAAAVEVLIRSIGASAPYLVSGGKVHVVAKRIPNAWENHLPAPLDVLNADYAVFNDQVSVILNQYYPSDAYLVTITAPAGGTTGDVQAPSVPAGLSAQAVSSSQINLTWNAATDNLGVTSYRIYRGGSQVASAAGTSYSDTGLTASTAYSYTVVAYDTAGNTSAQSSAASATTQAGTSGNLPDVVVTALSYADGVFTATVKNQGAAATPAGVYVGVGYFVDGQYKTGAYVSGPLAVNASVVILSGGVNVIADGVHAIMAAADDVDRFVESNETNNQLSQTITIGNTAPPRAAADLNADGSINVTDVQLAVNQALGTLVCAAGDVNKDSSCNVTDVQKIVNAALGVYK